MSARETLRAIADDVENCLAEVGADEIKGHAAALRALADRIDAEEASARHDDAEATTWQVGAAARARIKLLARLDADLPTALQKEPR